MEYTPELKIIKASKRAITNSKNPGHKLRVCAYCRVSTTSDEQKDSFNSQVSYYQNLIASDPNFENAGIYADEGISGVNADKRPDFQRMISDCMAGKIDVILVKSISRFARNTLDTLNYIRILKDKKVSVRFEEEHIDTMTSEGELLLTVLSSVAQQEVQNTSEHVKKGLKMKMTKGELVGFAGCLGYDTSDKTGELVINEAEAEIVRYIFSRYNQGAGATVIARELQERSWKTKYGSVRWSDSTIIGIIKNEKYKGDLLQGKTFTVDPISKRRLVNQGESDKFYITNHHEPIVSKEAWETANKILKVKSATRKMNPDGTRMKFTRQYNFSSLCECGFCGRTLTRRVWRGGKSYEKRNWQCMSYSKKGKNTCRQSKGIDEEVLKSAFVEAYNHLIDNDGNFLNDFIDRTADYMKSSNVRGLLDQCEEKIAANQSKLDKLTLAFIDGTLSQDVYDSKLKSLNVEKERLQKEKESLDLQSLSEADALAKLNEFRKAAIDSGGKKLESFSRDVFDTAIDKIIVGGYNENKKSDPFMLTYVFKKEFGSASNPIENKDYSVISEFSHYWVHISFEPTNMNERQKNIQNYIKVRIAISK